jgi:hypothetical protein
VIGQVRDLRAIGMDGVDFAVEAEDEHPIAAYGGV